MKGWTSVPEAICWGRWEKSHISLIVNKIALPQVLVYAGEMCFETCDISDDSDVQ